MGRQRQNLCCQWSGGGLPIQSVGIGIRAPTPRPRPASGRGGAGCRGRAMDGGDVSGIRGLQGRVAGGPAVGCCLLRPRARPCRMVQPYRQYAIAAGALGRRSWLQAAYAWLQRRPDPVLELGGATCGERCNHQQFALGATPLRHKPQHQVARAKVLAVRRLASSSTTPVPRAVLVGLEVGAWILMAPIVCGLGHFGCSACSRSSAGVCSARGQVCEGTQTFPSCQAHQRVLDRSRGPDLLPPSAWHARNRCPSHSVAALADPLPVFLPSAARHRPAAAGRTGPAARPVLSLHSAIAGGCMRLAFGRLGGPQPLLLLEAV